MQYVDALPSYNGPDALQRLVASFMTIGDPIEETVFEPNEALVVTGGDNEEAVGLMAFPQDMRIHADRREYLVWVPSLTSGHNGPGSSMEQPEGFTEMLWLTKDNLRSLTDA